MRPIILGFGLLILCLLVLFRIGEINFIKGDVRLEIIVAIAAFIFFFIGLYFNYKSGKKEGEKIPVKEKESTHSIPFDMFRKTGLTQREHEVLLKMAEGLSNQEIAESLFLSESTVKTHVSNILFKLEAKRRTQAVQIAKQLKIVP